jgi:hypothetical protein
MKDKIVKQSQALVAHTYNPSYSEAEIRIAVQSQPRANSLRDPVSKKPIKERAGEVAQGVGAKIKPQHRKKECKTVCTKVRALR